jgi:methionine transaminase
MPSRSKLPDVGTTIFTIMSRRARELGALNLGQGFPDYVIDPRLAELVSQAMLEGHNQYAPMEGVISLRQEIARKLKRSYSVDVDPDTEVTVTVGGTEAIYDAIQATVGAGDEAIVFDPAYDSYDPAIRLAGARCVHIPLQPPDFRYDWDRVRAAINDRTRLIVINSPHNPACTTATAADLDALAALTRDRPIALLSDEVYEHVVFDGRAHATVLRHPELRARSFVVFSFGKTLHATGWRTGYCVAPAALTTELRKVHQFNTFSVVHPLQHAIAAYLAEKPHEAFTGLAEFFQRKRDLLCDLLSGTLFELPPAEGTYFQLLDYEHLSHDEDDVTFANRLLTEGMLATIPLSPFYSEPPRLRHVRVCIAKADATLKDAVGRLIRFSEKPR